MQNIVNAALKFLEKRLTLLGDRVISAFTNATDKQAQQVNQIGLRFEKAVNKLSNPQFDVNVDFKPLATSLSSIASDLKKIEGKKGADISSVEATLKLLLTAVKENAPEKIGEKIDAMDVVFRGLKPSKTTKFDEAQMKGLMGALTQNRGITTQPGNKSATGWQVVKVALADADTEYEYAFPSNTVSWTLKLRGSSATTYYSHEAGKLPVSGDDSNYLTLPPSGTRSQDNVEWGGKKMFIESDSASQVLEIEVFTM